VLLGGPVEGDRDAANLLSKRVRARVVDQLSLPVKASAHQVLEETLRVEQRVERQIEKQVVEAVDRGRCAPSVHARARCTLRALAEERSGGCLCEGFSPKTASV